MTFEDKLSKLNDGQREAVNHIDGPLLVLAGAGSGKTTTIVHRAVNILLQNKAAPSEVLVLTFTKNAAEEMKERGAKILREFAVDKSASFDMEFSTFHSWGYNAIKNLGIDALSFFGLQKRPVIAIESTQKQIITAVVHSLLQKYLPEFAQRNKIAIKHEPIITAMSFLQMELAPCLPNTSVQEVEDSIMTNEGIREYNVLEQFSKSILKQTGRIKEPFMTTELVIPFLAELYLGYKKEMRRHNLVDFEDMIYIPVIAMRQFPEVKKYYHSKYKYIMVDEFQDTNSSQMALLKELVNKQNNICVVGDDYQSIYGWRGAKVENILNFNKIFPNVKVVNLNINYRSAAGIVASGNKIVKALNQHHESKEDLVPFFKERKGQIVKKFFQSYQDEFAYIARYIYDLIHENSVPPEEITILTRTNFLSKHIEPLLLYYRIPYKIIGGKNFIQYKDVQAMLTYLAFLHSPSDLLAKEFLESLDILTIKQITAIGNNISVNLLSGNIPMEKLKLRSKKKRRMEILIDNIKMEIGLLRTNFKMFASQKEDRVLYRLFENEEEDKRLGYASRLFDLMEKHSSFEDFLETISLSESDHHKEDTEGFVSVMTIHKAKGLEFDTVFIPGFVDGILPLDNADYNEEVRLSYVAVTRAKKLLIATGAAFYSHGKMSGGLSHLCESIAADH